MRIRWIALLLISTFASSLVVSAREQTSPKNRSSDGCVRSALITSLEQAARAPTQQQRLYIVTPVYRELKNGNFFRLLDSFAAQRANPEEFELFMVVNNIREVAAQRTEVFVENQQTLALIRYLEGGPLPTFAQKLAPWERNALLKFKEKGYRLHGIDLSTQGIDRNIGLIRDIGVRAAWKNGEKSGVEPIIALMDADTTVHPSYVKEIKNYFKDSDLDALFLSRGSRFNRSEDPRVFATTFEDQFKYKWRSFLQAIHLPGELTIKVGAPEIVARGSAIQSLGGVPHLKFGEDFALSSKLSETSRYKYAHNIEIKTTDRARPDGFVASTRLKNLSDGADSRKPLGLDTPTTTLLENAIERLYSKLGKNVTEDQLRRLFHDHGYSFDSKDWKAALKKIPPGPNESNTNMGMRMSYIFGRVYSTEQNSRFLNPLMSQPDQDLLLFMKSKLPSQEYNQLQHDIEARRRLHVRQKEMLKSWLKEIISGQPKSLEARTFLSDSPWLPNYIRSLKQETSDPGKMLELAAQDFPDWLRPFDQTPWKRHVETLDVVTRAIQESRNSSQRYPGLRNLFEEYALPTEN